MSRAPKTSTSRLAETGSRIDVKASLKDALTALKVSQPLRSERSAKALFVPPSGAIRSPEVDASWGKNGSQDTNLSQDQKVSQDSSVTEGQILSQDHLISRDQKIPQVTSEPRGTKLSQGTKVSRGTILPQDADECRVKGGGTARHPGDTLGLTASPTMTGTGREPINASDTGNGTEVPDARPEAQTTIPRGTSARRATEQDSAVLEYSRVSPGLAQGYTRLPNSLLVLMMRGELRSAEIRILLMIARLTISFGRHEAEISKRVIERMTGLQGRVVLEAMRALEAQGLVARTHGDAHRASRVRLTDPLLTQWFGEPVVTSTTWGTFLPQDQKIPRVTKLPQDTNLSRDTNVSSDSPLSADTIVSQGTIVPHDANILSQPYSTASNSTEHEPQMAVFNEHVAPTELASTTPSWGTKIPQGTNASWDQKVPPNKDIKRERVLSLSNSLSGNQLSEYLEKISLPRKRECEARDLTELLTAFDEEQVAQCLKFIQTKGIGSEGRPCHSPMAYLAKAMSGVLPHAQAWKLRQTRASALSGSEGDACNAAALKATSEAIEDAETSRRLVQAETELAARFADPHEQELLLREHLPIPGGALQSAVLSPVFRRLALLRWFESVSNSNKPHSTNEVKNA